MSAEQKSRKKNKSASAFFALLILALVIILVVNLVNGFIKIRNNSAQLSDLRKQKELLESENAELMYQIEISNTLEFVERIAREEYGLVKPREIIYVDANREKNKFTQYLNNKD